jgi:hypothetical protein
MTSVDVSRMCKLLGKPEAPLVKRGVREALDFFDKILGVDPFDWVDYFKGIDFHDHVHRLTLKAGTKLSRHRSTGSARVKPFVYFTKPGTSQHSTGTSFEESEFEKFEVASPVVALVSTASGIRFGREDRVVRAGGGIQYILRTDAVRYLEQIQ